MFSLSLCQCVLLLTLFMRFLFWFISYSFVFFSVFLFSAQLLQLLSGLSMLLGQWSVHRDYWIFALDYYLDLWISLNLPGLSSLMTIACF